MLTEVQITARANNLSRKINQLVNLFRHQLGSRNVESTRIMQVSHTLLGECAAQFIGSDFAEIEHMDDNETVETLISQTVEFFERKIRKHKERGLEKIASEKNE